MNWREWAKKTDRRHILALSGGKDSSALAVYLRDKVPNLEYVFCDTKKELKETYNYIDKLESFLNIKVHYLCYEDKQGFDDLLHMKCGFLPSANSRWCTEYLKLMKNLSEMILLSAMWGYVLMNLIGRAIFPASPE